MREIKFRAWFPKAKRMLHFDGVCIDDEYDRLAIDLVDSDAVIRYGHLAGESYLPNESFELMQYTGLHDKNGKEIYEGDIVRCKYWRDREGMSLGKILWCQDDACFIVEWVSGIAAYGASDMLDINHILEVIGNIWENPNLLEV